MYGALDISTSGMIAQRTRLEVISANIASRDAILDADGNYSPFRRRVVYFSPGDPSATTAAGRSRGVHVKEIGLDPAPLTPRYEPGSPHADAGGYVYYPNIDPVVEQINALSASRSYEANVAAAETTKQMFQSVLRLLA